MPAHSQNFDQCIPCFSPCSLHEKSSSGLEHLSLLEQLDLGHNLISKPVSARALSFNRSLKLLWLEGNPLAKGSRYRAALTCLLPHVRAIDLRGMPPSIDWKRRVLGENRSDGGSMMRAGSGVSRERQVGQDKRRSNEWQQVEHLSERVVISSTSARSSNNRTTFFERVQTLLAKLNVFHSHMGP